ncbi:MAG: hypothetical protein CVU96_01020 [Firmicutes bacterium HGW-Firmicutes-20]|jgi:hypothetical protein|nr:MAG: hypothetical protein CVU96_01020 [Firmicutes bacterium HGW-Firmicutes-20]
MKYIYVLLIACLVIILGCIGYIRQPLKGDVNCDRRVSVTDLVILSRYLAEMDTMMCPGNADMNDDYVIDILDMDKLQRKLAGLEN